MWLHKIFRVSPQLDLLVCQHPPACHASTSSLYVVLHPQGSHQVSPGASQSAYQQTWVLKQEDQMSIFLGKGRSIFNDTIFSISDQTIPFIISQKKPFIYSSKLKINKNNHKSLFQAQNEKLSAFYNQVLIHNIVNEIVVESWLN